MFGDSLFMTGSSVRYFFIHTFKEKESPSFPLDASFSCAPFVAAGLPPYVNVFCVCVCVALNNLSPLEHLPGHRKSEGIVRAESREGGKEVNQTSFTVKV